MCFSTRIKNRLALQVALLRKLDKQAGASLIEVMVAVAIIVILMSAIGLAVVGNIKKANNAMAAQNIDTIKMGIKMFQLDNGGQCPETLDLIGVYLDPPQLPKDPWKRDFVYDKEKCLVLCTGEDGEAGTDDDIPKPSEDKDAQPSENP